MSPSWASEEGWEPDEAGSDSDAEATEEATESSRSEDSFSRSSRELVARSRETMDEANDALSRLSSEVSEDTSFEESYSDPNRYVSDGSELDPELEKLLDKYFERAKKAEKAQKKSAKRRWLFISLGIMVAAGLGTLIYALMRRDVQGKGDSDIADRVPEDVRQALKALVQKWQAESDAVFWRDFADAIDAGLVIDGTRREFTLADQILFLNFTKELNPLRDVWLWDSSADVEQNAAAIKRFYDATRKVSDIYRHVLEVEYQGRPMPRSIAADQLQIVLARIGEEQPEDT